jgi:hypothetical protein
VTLRGSAYRFSRLDQRLVGDLVGSGVHLGTRRTVLLYSSIVGTVDCSTLPSAAAPSPLSTALRIHGKYDDARQLQFKCKEPSDCPLERLRLLPTEPTC